MALTGEPTIASRLKPEETFETAVLNEAKAILESQKEKDSLIEYFLLPHFGLDIAVFLQWKNRSMVRFLELKAFVGSRQGGIGFGNQRGFLLPPLTRESFAPFRPLVSFSRHSQSIRVT